MFQTPQKSPPPNEYEVKGVKYKKGDVIIKEKDGTMGVLESIYETETSPLPFLPKVRVHVPKCYVHYVPTNDKGEQVFIRLKGEVGIGTMNGFRHATKDECQKLCQAVLQEKHFVLNLDEQTLRYVPTIGDIAIGWNTKPQQAVIGVIKSTEGGIVFNDGISYANISSFENLEQYQNLIKENE